MQVLGMDLTKSAVLSVLPWVTMALSANFGGWLADSAVDRGVPITTVRKVRSVLFCDICFLFPSCFSVRGAWGMSCTTVRKMRCFPFPFLCFLSVSCARLCSFPCTMHHAHGRCCGVACSCICLTPESSLDNFSMLFLPASTSLRRPWAARLCAVRRVAPGGRLWGVPLSCRTCGGCM